MMSAAFGSEMMSSGCESGWTLYLDHSHCSNLIGCDDENRKPARRLHGKIAPFNNDDDEEDQDDTEEEDMSMMSDASSGPPHQYCHGHYQDQAVEVNYNDHHRSSHCNENNTVGQDNCYYGSHAISHCCDSPSKSKSTSTDGKKLKRNGKAGSSSTTTHLDDTASSSPYFNDQDSIGVTNWQRQGSMESLFDYSQGFSTTHDHHFQMGNKLNRRRRTIK